LVFKAEKAIDWWIAGGSVSASDKLLDQIFKPLTLWDEEREKQNSRKELLRQCQGEWEGLVQLRSEDLSYGTATTRVRAMIEGDRFKIIEAESRPDLVGVTWKIGCFDDEEQKGIYSNKNYPKSSSIFLKYQRLPSGEESLNEGVVFNLGSKTVTAYVVSKQLVRPVAPPTPEN